MKYAKKAIVMLIGLFVIISTASISASAMDTGLVTEPISDIEFADTLNHRRFAPIFEPVELLPVHCFDVRDDHAILLGTKAGTTVIVAVYDDTGTFQYGFKTAEHYGDFRIEWSGEHILFNSVRGGLVFEIDDTGKILDIRRTVINTENRIYERNVLLSNERQVDDYIYEMTNGNPIVDKLSSSYGKVTKTNEEGTVLIYDASSNRTLRVLVGVVIFLLMSAFIAVGVTAGIKKHIADMNAINGSLD